MTELGSVERRARVAAAALVVLLLALSAAVAPWRTAVSGGPNIVLIISDDQSMDTLPHVPPAMPFLQERMQDPSDHWISFANAFINDPLCCPSRATILTGQYCHHTHVLKNGYGRYLKESSTVATWLHSVGYYTGYFGKYINRYPFERTPYVPPGWDHWAAKLHGGPETTYYDYTLVENGGREVPYGSAPRDYMPTLLANKTAEFISTVPGGRPFFAVYAPTVPHAPWVPAPGGANTFASNPPEPLPNFNEKNVSDKPEWVQALPRLSEPQRRKLAYEHRLEFDALLGLDDGVRTVFQALQDRGVLDDTVVIFLTDNGYSFGSHRWVGKRCEYDECNHTPLLVRWPGAESSQISTPVSNADIAPTLAQLAEVKPGLREDGISLLPLLAGDPSAWLREGVLLEWPGDAQVPRFWAVRTEGYLYAELATGERELYDLAGVHGEADPWMLHNVVDDDGYAKIRDRLSRQLADLRAGAVMPPAPDLPPSQTP